jgi:hypothetical protein
MTNPYYTKTFDVSPGTGVGSQSIENQFLLVEQGFDSVETAKASVNSPAFTGTPTAPTAAGTDDSTKLATTAHVKRALQTGVQYSASATRQSAVATANQTVFTLATAYTPNNNNINVFINGVRQFPGSYTETNATTVTFSSGLTAGDEVLFETGIITTGSTSSAILTSFTPTPSIPQTNVQDALANYITPVIRSARTSNTMLGTADKGSLIDITSGSFTQTFDAAATLGNGWWCYIRNADSFALPQMAQYDNISLNVTAQVGTQGRVMAMSLDGTKLYVMNSGGSSFVYQYTLPTAFSLASATFASRSVNVSAQVSTAGSGLAFSSDGTRMFVTNASSIFQYTLSTAWDVSSAIYASKTSSLTISNCYGLSFSPDGTKFYIANAPATVATAVLEFTATTAWDVAAIALANTLTVSSRLTNPRGVAISADGARLLIGVSTNCVVQYNVATPFNLSTATFADVHLNTTIQIQNQTQLTGILLRPDNSNQLYILDPGGSFTQIYSHTLPAAGSVVRPITSATANDVTLAAASGELIDGLASYPMYGGEVRLVQCDGTTLTTTVLSAFTKAFTASGTFIRPPRYRQFLVELWGAGGGGGSGSSGATPSNAKGGGGGGGGYTSLNVSFSAMPLRTDVSVGAGGAGGNAVNGSAGNAGTAGGNTTFGGLAIAGGGTQGSGGTSAGVIGGGGVGGYGQYQNSIQSSGQGNLYGGGSATNNAMMMSIYGGGAGGTENSAGKAGISIYGGGGGAGGGGSSTLESGWRPKPWARTAYENGGASPIPDVGYAIQGLSGVVLGMGGGIANSNGNAGINNLPAGNGGIAGGGGGGGSNTNGSNLTSSKGGDGGNGLCIVTGVI